MSFNPDQFLDMQIEGENSTVSTPVPEGEYMAIAEKVSTRQWQKKDDPSISGVTLEVLWDIQDEAVKAELGRDKVVTKQGIMLDLTDSGGLDMGKGKNVGLGRLREAIGRNTPGQVFAFSMIPGSMAKVSVKHRLDDKTVPPTTYAEVRGVAKP